MDFSASVSTEEADIGVPGRIVHLIMVVAMATMCSSTMATSTLIDQTISTITEIMSLLGMCSVVIVEIQQPPDLRDRDLVLNLGYQQTTETELQAQAHLQLLNSLQIVEPWQVQEPVMFIPTKPEMFTTGTVTATGVSAREINGKEPSNLPR
jgi:hypothetical protein